MVPFWWTAAPFGLALTVGRTAQRRPRLRLSHRRCRDPNQESAIDQGDVLPEAKKNHSPLHRCNDIGLQAENFRRKQP
jgi:hypothetical protein